MNRDIWCGIFEVLFVPPAEYSNLVCILSYLLVSRFSLAYCRVICISALVEILAENFLSFIILVISVFFFFNLRLLIFNDFFLFQQFRLGCRTVWRDCRTGPGDKDEIG
jgi:hypothetical protein